MVPQLQFQARAALVFGELHNSILMDRVRGISYEMLRWLTTQYGLDIQGASQLLGQCVRYDLGNVFDPAYTMVCKMPKKLLQRLPTRS